MKEAQITFIADWNRLLPRSILATLLNTLGTPETNARNGL
jgi:hypothetical protein